ncbi:hypothetical protein D046_6782 [Vibrio parahaemolyticus V-223/04]|nr:hypothetical protein D046_6782 [Vibrio parahaemolyticus V-223/04]
MLCGAYLRFAAKFDRYSKRISPVNPVLVVAIDDDLKKLGLTRHR